MINPFRPLGAAVRDLFDDMLLLLGCNMIWCILSLPILWVAYIAAADAPVAAALTAMVGVLPAGPATAGLAYVAHRVSEGRATKLGDFFVGMRRHARSGWQLLGIWMAGLLVIFFNIGFYLGVSNLLAAVVLGLWIYGLIIWLALLIYIFPLMLLQEQPNLRTIARNAALMCFGRPIFTIVSLILMLLVIGISIFLAVPIILFSVAFVNIWSVRATRTLIEEAERRRAIGQAATQPPVEERGRRGQIRPK